MAALSVRVSEDPARPLGHAIVTLTGLPPGLETFEFALSRHGFTANHLSADGWQGAECWLQPEEAWYSGQALKFVISPDLAFQLENMPYTLAVRGQGLTDAMAATFVWPLELELEEGSASSERRVVGGTRVDSAPKPRPEPATHATPVVEPPPWPPVSDADLPIPEVAIPDLAAHPEIGVDGDQPTQVVGPRARPPHSPSDKPTQVVAGRMHPGVAGPERPVGADSTRKISERRVPSPRANHQPPIAPAAPAPVTLLPSAPAEKSPTVAAPPRQQMPVTEPSPVPTEATGKEKRPGGIAGWLIGLIAVAVLAALGGWWWFSQRPGSLPAKSTATVSPSSNRGCKLDKAMDRPRTA